MLFLSHAIHNIRQYSTFMDLLNFFNKEVYVQLKKLKDITKISLLYPTFSNTILIIYGNTLQIYTIH